MSQHGGENAPLNVGDVGELLQVAVVGLQRTVHGVVGEVEEEGLARVTGDEVAGFATEGVREITAFGDGLAHAKQWVVGVVVRLVAAHVGAPNDATIGGGPAAFGAIRQRLATKPSGRALPRRRHKVVTFVQESEELVKPTSARMIRGGSAEMPLADQRRGVAGVAQPVSDGGLFDRQSDGGIAVARPDRIELKAEARLVPTCHDCRARGGAEGRGHIAAGEPDTVGSDGVNVRRRNVAALATEFAVAEIVSDDEKNVGALGSVSE